jgi:hypothetical protein
MEAPPHHNFIDVLWVPGKALKAKKIAAMTLSLLAALLLYDIFTYLALSIEGENLDYIYSAYGLAPFMPPAFDLLAAQLVYALGLVAALLIVMIGLLSVAIIDLEEVRGNPFLSLWGAIRFAFTRFWQVVLSELSIGLFVGVVVLLGMLLGLITRIPVIGDWLFAVTFIIPNLVVAIFTVFVILVLVVSWLLLPAVAAAERKGEVFYAILETFATIMRQPFRWLGYTAYSVVAAKLCGFIYAYFCFRAVQFIVWTASLGGGGRPEDIVKAGLSRLPVNSDLVKQVFNVFPGLDWSFSVSYWAIGNGSGAVGHLMAAMLAIIFASVLGYMFAILASAQARGYIAIRFRKDDYDIALEKPLLLDEEHVNPPVETS